MEYIDNKIDYNLFSYQTTEEISKFPFQIFVQDKKKNVERYKLNSCFTL